MIKHKDSHLDHGLTDAQVAYILARFADRSAFFLETIQLPAELGTVRCGLYGPAMGDHPIPDDVTFLGRRSMDRTWGSRMVDWPSRPTRDVTVIGGPHDGHTCVLFTAYGGPAAPQEPGDPNCRNPAESKAFWAVHALAGDPLMHRMETKCDRCGDESNSAPGLQCGRVEFDEITGSAITDPCTGIYR